MSKESKDFKTYRVRFSHELVVRSGKPEAVAEAARLFREAMMPPFIRETVEEIEDQPETRGRIRMVNNVPVFFRIPLTIGSTKELRDLKAEQGENAKVENTEYVYMATAAPDPQIDPSRSVTSAHGGIWFEVAYLQQLQRQARQKG